MMHSLALASSNARAAALAAKFLLCIASCKREQTMNEDTTLTQVVFSLNVAIPWQVLQDLLRCYPMGHYHLSISDHDK